MKRRFQGRIWKFGDNIDTDVITPGKYENCPFDELCRHCLEPINPAFARRIRKDDILVAGFNFGCGSAREIAPRALQQLGVGAIVARSFSRTFFRNAVAIGLPVLIAPAAVDDCREGDRMMIDLRRSRLENVTTHQAIPMEPIPENMYAILADGGLFASLQNKRRLLTKGRNRPTAVARDSRSNKARRSGGRG
jgi:3-isopropylmalate dehydratase small subunit